MSAFRRDAQGRALLAGADLAELRLRAGVATPAYFYDLDSIRDTARDMEAALDGQPHVIAYAVKANSAGSILRTLFHEGLGADVVSGAELSVALGAGIPADRIVMSGVAKTDAEIDQAIASGILALQVESVEELVRTAARARAAGRTARVAPRVNPGIEIDSHAHIRTGHDGAKFGIALADMPAALAYVDANPELLRCVGVSAHIGSMQTNPERYQRSGEVLAELAQSRRARSAHFEYVNFGGGIGIDYGEGPISSASAFVKAARDVLAAAGLSELRLLMEPGRALVGPSGVLLASVVQHKVSGPRRWLMIDAGMNDLLRPALYSAHHRIEPSEWLPGELEWRVVGPVCESSDDFGAHPLGEALPESVVIRDVGAYGFVMASEYNGRALPAEVFVSQGEVVSVSRGQTIADWAKRRLSA